MVWGRICCVLLVLLGVSQIGRCDDVDAGRSGPAGKERATLTVIESTEEVVGLLRKLAAEIRANEDQIETWSATFRFQDRSYGRPELAEFGVPESFGPPYSVHEAGHGRFVLDMRSDELFTYTEADQVPLVIDPVTFQTHALESVGPRAQASLVTAEHFVSFRPHEKYGAFEEFPDVSVVSERAAFREPPERGGQDVWAQVIDPRTFLGWGNRFWKEFEIYADKLEQGLDGEEKITVKVRESGRGDADLYIVEYSVPTPPEGRLTFVARCESRVGFNVTRYECRHSGEGPRHRMTIGYETSDGIRVPGDISAEWPADDGEHLRFQRILKMEGIALNEPIEAGTFSYTQLGLEDGERVLDRIDSTLYVLRDGELTIPPVIARGAIEPVRGNSGWIVWCNVLLLGLLLVVGGAMALRRRRVTAAGVDDAHERGE
ncbi:hypothetical protein [Maioricimonas sp. JC845]|uniref:hypothetical protein n=1 Tax=Maioricimonas sp. JC845 TaxID=3232138 RepID=UPI003457BD65